MLYARGIPNYLALIGQTTTIAKADSATMGMVKGGKWPVVQRDGSDAE